MSDPPTARRAAASIAFQIFERGEDRSDHHRHHVQDASNKNTKDANVSSSSDLLLIQTDKITIASSALHTTIQIIDRLRP